jgi:hypothetical protein
MFCTGCGQKLSENALRYSGWAAEDQIDQHRGLKR